MPEGMALTSTATANAPAAHASGDAQQGLEGTNLIDIAGAVLPGTYGSGLGTVARNVVYRPGAWSRAVPLGGWVTARWGAPSDWRMLPPRNL